MAAICQGVVIGLMWSEGAWLLPRRFEFAELLSLLFLFIYAVVPFAIAFYYFWGGLFAIVFALREFKED